MKFIVRPLFFPGQARLPVTLGGYRNPRSPDEPMILHLVHTPNTPNRGLTANEQCRRGQEKLLNMTFAGYEERIRDLAELMLISGRPVKISPTHYCARDLAS
jgi:hypothetical protein